MILFPPDIDNFPTIYSFFEVRDASGVVVEDLSAENVQVLEDNNLLPVSDLLLLQPGAQFVFAINPSINFAIRDVQGNTRYDYMVQALISWAERQTNPDDDLSLIFANSPGLQHSDVKTWLDALKEAPSDHRNAAPNLQTLSRAIGLASDPTNKPGMGKGVLFITPNPEADAVPVFENLASIANQAGVKIYVWMVSSEAFFNTRGALALQQLAIDTGGQFFAYSGTDPLPDVEKYIAPLRSVYQLKYQSRITYGGDHTLNVQLNTSTVEATSTEISFSLSPLPPNPIFVSPPPQIFRYQTQDDGIEITVPVTQTLDLIIEFPDGYARPLSRTTLYVDGEIATENYQPPFDTFTWDLTGYQETGRHILQVEAVDTLGMSSISLETPVEITVQIQTSGLSAAISRNSSIIAGISVLVAGAILILVLIIAVRIRPQPAQIFTQNWENIDPVYQPIDSEESTTTGRLQIWATQLQTRLQWPPRSSEENVPMAYLERLLEPGDLENITPIAPISIASPEVLLGTDPQKATLILDDPSVNPLHARLTRTSDEGFYIFDEESVAGTWLNFTPVGKAGAPVENGDLIHIGRICFRFKLHKPLKVYSPLITRKDIKL